MAVNKTDETLHEECHLKLRKEISDVSFGVLFQLSDQTQSENINFIKICKEKLLFLLP